MTKKTKSKKQPRPEEDADVTKAAEKMPSDQIAPPSDDRDSRFDHIRDRASYGSVQSHTPGSDVGPHHDGKIVDREIGRNDTEGPPIDES